MHLRDYRPSDLESVHVINQGEVPAVGSEEIADLAHIAAESVIALVAEVDDAMAGFCMVLAPGADYDSGNYQWFSERYDDFVYLDRIAIPSSYQRLGIGRAMYAEVEQRTGRVRPTATWFTLEVNLEPRNDRSLAFHAAMGFVEVGQRATEYGSFVSLMAKPLTNRPA
ncbi:MAG: GNAT family N-acetyltransferase [Ilumatobacteraceae bacterium]